LIVPISIHDGDTFKFFWLVSGTARLHGIQAPEVIGPEKDRGLAAKSYLGSLLPLMTPAAADVFGVEKYGRTLMDVLLADGQSLAAKMVSADHAVPYLKGISDDCDD
jgi:endonuclease YncB( thermonuclease family)